ncbi:serine/arginine-rich splicing factor 9-like [Choloepus didactylus]|uniref:serine/arginine-rich splicing factor 9-like n=1 Tax=Choloepus didactylus TaxID=27675 RepID=UPI00189D8838|nr:serine/arginine-rich splicing factor 9-like [Choloepus didactylus]
MMLLRPSMCRILVINIKTTVVKKVLFGLSKGEQSDDSEPLTGGDNAVRLSASESAAALRGTRAATWAAADPRRREVRLSGRAGGRGGEGDGRIHVGNLPTDVREKDLEDLFYKYGCIREIELKNRHYRVPFAFVRLEDPRDAEDAAYGRNGYDYGQCWLRVEFPRTRGGRGGWPPGGRNGPPTRSSDFRVIVSGLPPSGSWQDLKDHMREAGDVCYADAQKDGMGMVECLRKEDMEYALHKLDDTKFRSHEGETSYIRVYPERGTSYGYSRSRSGSRGRDSPYQSRGSPHYFSPFRPH